MDALREEDNRSGRTLLGVRGKRERVQEARICPRQLAVLVVPTCGRILAVVESLLHLRRLLDEETHA